MYEIRHRYVQEKPVVERNYLFQIRIFFKRTHGWVKKAGPKNRGLEPAKDGWFGLSPPPSNSGKWRFSSGSPTKNIIILVMTGILGRGTTQWMIFFFKFGWFISFLQVTPFVSNPADGHQSIHYHPKGIAAVTGIEKWEGHESKCIFFPCMSYFWPVFRVASFRLVLAKKTSKRLLV